MIGDSSERDGKVEHENSGQSMTITFPFFFMTGTTLCLASMFLDFFQPEMTFSYASSSDIGHGDINSRIRTAGDLLFSVHRKWITINQTIPQSYIE